jgi:hypothetical protein
LTTAVIFIPAGQLELYASTCLAYCTTKDYEFGGFVHDWRGVIDVLHNGLATVVIVARLSHIDPTWEPRVEVASGATSDKYDNSRSPSLRRRRPNRI